MASKSPAIMDCTASQSPTRSVRAPGGQLPSSAIGCCAWTSVVRARRRKMTASALPDGRQHDNVGNFRDIERGLEGFRRYRKR